MKNFLCGLLLVLGVSMHAQEPPRATPANRMVFQPGAKVPEPRAVPVPGGPLEPEVMAEVEAFFAALERGEVDAAYDALVTDTAIAEKPEDVTTLKARTTEALTMFGSIKAWEILSVERVGTRLLGATCLSAGEKFPLRWRFFFYRAGEQWKLIDIRVDDRFGDLFTDKVGTTEDPAE